MRITVIGAAAAVSIILLAPFESPLAQDRPSARIEALGGRHVEGIIPDLFTDLLINPAYAFEADRITLRYERKTIQGYTTPIPVLSGSMSRYFSFNRDTYVTDGLSASGMELSGWRAAIFLQWRLSQSESVDSESNPRAERISIASRWQSGDNHFGSIDLLAARTVGGDWTLGVGLRASGFYKSSSEVRASLDQYYGDVYYSVLERDWDRQTANSFLGRRMSFGLRAGLLRAGGRPSRTELVLDASVDPLEHEIRYAYQDIDKEYDSAQRIDDYYYLNEYWGDRREGEIWRLGLSLRHTFASSARIYAGGSVSAGSYDAGWDELIERYSWGGWNPTDEILAGGFDCEGSLRGADCFVKGGRTFALRPDLDLSLGAHGRFAWRRASEDPAIRYGVSHRADTSSLVLSEPAELDYSGNEAGIFLPLSIEYRPAGWFSCFAGFVMGGEWSKDSVSRPALAPFVYNPPGADLRFSRSASAEAAQDPAATVTDWERGWKSDSYVTLGFSLRYRDRLFVDVYSGSQVIPSSLNYAMVDVRYAF